MGRPKRYLNVTTEFKSRGPELLIDLIDKTAAVLQETVGLEHDSAHKCAEAVANRMRMEWGGQQVYFPKGLAADITKRDLELYQEFDGTNHEQLARKYDLSVQWVYKIVKNVQAFEVARRQIDMFPDNLPTIDTK